MKAQIEIYERSSGKTVETQDVEDLTAFRLYWDKQANHGEFAFRILGGSDKPLEHRVAKEPDGKHRTEGETEFLPFNDETCALIASHNGGMTASEVHAALMQGRFVYTTFNRYRLEN